MRALAWRIAQGVRDELPTTCRHWPSRGRGVSLPGAQRAAGCGGNGHGHRHRGLPHLHGDDGGRRQVLGIQRLRPTGGWHNHHPDDTGGRVGPDQWRGRRFRRICSHLRRDDRGRHEVLGMERLRPTGGRHNDGPVDAGLSVHPPERRGRRFRRICSDLRPDDSREGQVLGGK